MCRHLLSFRIWKPITKLAHPFIHSSIVASFMPVISWRSQLSLNSYSFLGNPQSACVWYSFQSIYIYSYILSTTLYSTGLAMANISWWIIQYVTYSARACNRFLLFPLNGIVQPIFFRRIFFKIKLVQRLLLSNKVENQDKIWRSPKLIDLIHCFI